MTGSNTAATYLGDITGVDEVLNGITKEISGLSVINDYTLQVTIDAPKAYFLAKLTYPTTFVVDQENVTSGQNWWQKPNGSGPYKLKQWQKDDILVMEANTRFHRQSPRIAELRFHLLAGLPVSLYEMNEIDIAPVYEYDIERATDPAGPFHDQLSVFPELSLYYIGFNTVKPPFDDPLIRKAFCLAVNKEKIISVIQKNMVTRADGILPPGIPGYNDRLAGLDYNPDEANRLIANSKYGSIENLPPITITTSGWGGNISASLGAVIQEWHDNLGIMVTVKQLEPEIFLYHLSEEADAMFMLGWVADYPDPQNFLENLFLSDSAYNTGKYSNQAVDTLLQNAGMQTDHTTRMSMYQDIEEIVLNEAACLPLWFSTNYVLVKPYVKNFSLNAMGIANFSTAYIEP
jgi:oligopeptide transport system substrate-binding protein